MRRTRSQRDFRLRQKSQAGILWDRYGRAPGIPFPGPGVPSAIEAQTYETNGKGLEFQKSDVWIEMDTVHRFVRQGALEYSVEDGGS